MAAPDPMLDEIDDDGVDGETGEDARADGAGEPGDEDPDEEHVPWGECKVAGIRDYGHQRVYLIDWYGGIMELGEDIGRIVDQYEAVRRRQAEAQALAERRWRKPAPEPDPAELAPGAKLTPRQEEFCRHYAARPVASHAALLAGYGEENARQQGSRLLKNPLVLARVEALRADRGARHALDAATLQDKLESVFVDALTANHHTAAVAALRLQAGLARLPTRPTARDEAGPAAAPAQAAQPEASPPHPTEKQRQRADKSRARGRKKPSKAHKRRQKPTL